MDTEAINTHDSVAGQFMNESPKKKVEGRKETEIATEKITNHEL